MTDSARKTLGLTIYEDQVDREVHDCNRLGNRNQNPEPQNSRSTGRFNRKFSPGEGRSAGCSSAMIAEAILAIMVGNACTVFPTSDCDHPSEYVLVIPSASKPKSFSTQRFRWDLWQFEYLPLIRDLLNGRSNWTHNLTDRQIVEGRVQELPSFLASQFS